MLHFTTNFSSIYTILDPLISVRLSKHTTNYKKPVICTILQVSNTSFVSVNALHSVNLESFHYILLFYLSCYRWTSFDFRLHHYAFSHPRMMLQESYHCFIYIYLFTWGFSAWLHRRLNTADANSIKLLSLE